ncbi:MAG: glutamine--tRNA ligase [Firmicutes bacterium]|nr:glutamine--tRNA ligase [Bacillota bacterium]
MENKESLNWIERDIIESKAKGQTIITRFPPEPNGYMHIGHAKASFWNFTFAQKYGDGHFNLRFDDTNPEKEDMHYVETMIADLKWLGIKWKNLCFASDYYQLMYDLACGLINRGLAYVDFQTADQITATRGNFQISGVQSPYRNTTAEDNLKIFADMKAGKYKDGVCVLRAKIDMAHGNMCMRDPIIYCIKHTPHYRTQNKWCIYPLYDYAHPLEDAIEFVSHSNCSLEFDNNRPLYDWYIDNIWDDLESRRKTPKGSQFKPRQSEFSRLNIEQFVMSKRYLKRFVDEQTVDGWDDPRMPTISGMRRRGYTPEAILAFVESTGLSRTPMTVPMSALEFYIRTHLDPIATRVSVVQNPILVKITNYTNKSNEYLQIANNPHDETFGKHEITFGKEIYIDADDFNLNPPPKYKRLFLGGTIRLKGAYIIKCDNVVTAPDGSISYLECTYFENSKSGFDTSGIKPNGVINYVHDGVEIQINEYQPLLHSGTDLAEENLNRDSKKTFTALAEKYLIDLHKDLLPKSLQFVRKGFYTLDKKLSTSDNLIFTRTVGLKEGM